MIGYVISALIIGLVLGFATAIVMQQMASDKQAERRQRRRALLDLPDRPPRRSGAVGTARVHTGDYIVERWPKPED